MAALRGRDGAPQNRTARRDTGMPNETLALASKRNFIQQQGLDPPAQEQCPRQFSALLFQPRIVALVLIVAVALQSPSLFFALGALLWWSALVPTLNPFDAAYNAIARSRPQAARLGPAPAPRRFAQTLAGAFSIGIAASLVFGKVAPAYVLEALFGIAVIALAFGRFCLGSFIFHLLTGRGDFARKTLPWVRQSPAERT